MSGSTTNFGIVTPVVTEADSAEAVTTAYTLIDTKLAAKTGVHGVGSSYIAKTSRSDQAIEFEEIANIRTSFNPATHAASHGTGQSDVIAPSVIGASPNPHSASNHTGQIGTLDQVGVTVALYSLSFQSTIPPLSDSAPVMNIGQASFVAPKSRALVQFTGSITTGSSCTVSSSLRAEATNVDTWSPLISKYHPGYVPGDYSHSYLFTDLPSGSTTTIYWEVKQINGSHADINLSSPAGWITVIFF